MLSISCVSNVVPPLVATHAAFVACGSENFNTTTFLILFLLPLNINAWCWRRQIISSDARLRGISVVKGGKTWKVLHACATKRLYRATLSLRPTRVWAGSFSDVADMLWPVAVRSVTSLGRQEGRRVFREGPKFFELCPIFLNYVQHIFPEGGEKFPPPSGYGTCSPDGHRMVLGQLCLGANRRQQQPIAKFFKIYQKNILLCYFSALCPCSDVFTYSCRWRVSM